MKLNPSSSSIEKEDVKKAMEKIIQMEVENRTRSFIQNQPSLTVGVSMRLDQLSSNSFFNNKSFPDSMKRIYVHLQNWLWSK